MATIRGFKKRGADLLNGLALTLYNPHKFKPIEIYDIGKKKLSKNSKRALIIYVLHAVRFYLKSELDKFPYLYGHSMWRETIEMIKALNEAGYIVDYFDVYSEHKIDWPKYDLIIDERNSISSAPQITGQTKIFYSTGVHWLTWNLAELTRIKQFSERNGIIIPPVRQAEPYFSDLSADYLTYFGNQNQLIGFSDKPQKYCLNISAFVPEYQEKNIDKCRNNFLWIGSTGLIHKGLDLAIEAFKKIPDAELYIAGDISSEPLFEKWCTNILKTHPNIHYLGWMNVSSPQFKEIADKCIGIVYPSGAEGGAGAVVQVMHHGLIPIITTATYLRGEHLGRIIDSLDDLEIINKTIDYVNEIRGLSENELTVLSNNAREFALATHTIEKYTESFRALLQLIK